MTKKWTERGSAPQSPDIPDAFQKGKIVLEKYQHVKLGSTKIIKTKSTSHNCCHKYIRNSSSHFRTLLSHKFNAAEDIVMT